MSVEEVSKTEEDQQGSYLEDKDNIVPGLVIGECLIEQAIREEEQKTERCGKTLMSYVDNLGIERTYPRKCQKLFCETCGGRNHYMHNKRMRKFRDKLGETRKYSIQRYTFTIPKEIQENLKDRNQLNKLIDKIKRIITSVHGEITGTRRRAGKIENIFSLNKKTLVTLELTGTEGNFNPHVNVLILNEDGTDLRIPAATLEIVKKKFKKALSRMFSCEIPVVVVNYKFYPHL